MEIKPHFLQCTFTIKGNKQVFHGALLAFLGDTPAVCRVGGFKESVGFADRKCRHCMATDSQIQQKVTITSILNFSIFTCMYLVQR